MKTAIVEGRPYQPQISPGKWIGMFLLAIVVGIVVLGLFGGLINMMSSSS